MSIVDPEARDAAGPSQAMSPAQSGFRSAEAAIGAMAPLQVSQLISASSDIAIVLDEAGTILDLSISEPDLAGQVGNEWLNRRMIDTVSPDSRRKVETLLNTAEGDGLSWQEINHVIDGADVPVRYVAVRLPAKVRWSSSAETCGA